MTIAEDQELRDILARALASVPKVETGCGRIFDNTDATEWNALIRAGLIDGNGEVIEK